MVVQATLWSAAATLGRAFLGLTLNKIAAVAGGPAAVAALGNFLNLFMMATSLATCGTANGVVKYMSQYSDSPARQQALVRTAAAMALTSSILAATCLMVRKEAIADALFFATGYGWAIALLSICL